MATDEVYAFLDQTNISAKNIQRLRDLDSIDNITFQSLRAFVLEIATVTPRKRKRTQILREKHPDLFHRMVQSNLFDLFPDAADESGLVWEDSDAFN